MPRKLKNKNSPDDISPEFMDALVASGLVHGLRDVAELKPFYRHLEENEALCERGEPADCLWVIIEGTLAIRSGDETLVVRTSSSVVGEQALLDDVGRRRADVVASLGPAKVLEIRKTAIDSHPQSARIWRNCAWILSSKLDEATHHYSQIEGQRKELQQLLRLYVGEHALSEGKLAPVTRGLTPRVEHAVIWFSDIVGFTKYTSSMLPEQVANFVQQFLAPQVEAIERHRGLIDKFIGDAVMAYWIINSRDGMNECQLALKAAHESTRRLAAIKFGAGSVNIRIGLHVGKVMIGNFGTPLRSNFTLIGREVNKTARIENAKEPDVVAGGPLGAIRVSHDFFLALGRSTAASLPRTATIRARGIGDLLVHTPDPDFQTATRSGQGSTRSQVHRKS